MPIYIDKAENQLGRMKMSHMFADTIGELYFMAAKIGLRRSWFQNHKTPHYDLCKSKKKLAIELGAIEIDNKKVVELIRKWKDD